MKFFEIDEEYLKKGGLISRDKKSGLAFGIVNNRLVAFNNGIKKEPEEIFKGYGTDLLADDWEYISYSAKKPLWKPESGDTIYYVSSTGHVYEDTFAPCSTCDNDKVSFNNAFQTREEAQHMLEKIKIINKLRELSNIKFSENKSKYFIYYNFRENKVRCGETNLCKLSPFEACFKTGEDCENAIKEIGEENLKKYYFDVED